jgi:hypothetical protein
MWKNNVEAKSKERKNEYQAEIETEHKELQEHTWEM